MKPNARFQLLPKAGAKRTLEAVSCKALFGFALSPRPRPYGDMVPDTFSCATGRISHR
jgi:hypothetical protein